MTVEELYAEWQKAESTRIVIGNSGLSDDHYRRAYVVAAAAQEQYLKAKSCSESSTADQGQTDAQSEDNDRAV